VFPTVEINIKALGVNHTPFQVKWSVPPMIRYLDVAIIEHEVNLIVKPGLIHYIVFLLDDISLHSGHIILIPSQPVFALALNSACGEATQTNLKVFGLTRPGLEHHRVVRIFQRTFILLKAHSRNRMKFILIG
jgi:hypothetical protein